MITLNGATGKGTLLGTFYLADRESSGQGTLVQGHFDQCTPPSDWYMPPPDKVWYTVVGSPYGPRLSRIQVGDIQSVDINTAEWNPCEHSTLRGDALYLGPDGSRAPYWRKMAASGKTDYTACVPGSSPPMPAGKFVSVMRGRPCTQSDNKVYDRYGAMATTPVTASPTEAQRYWYVDSTLPATIAPAGIQSALSQLGQLHAPDTWYCRKSGTNTVPVSNPIESVEYWKHCWRRSGRTTFIRESWNEYHTTASYTPAASVGYTGYGNLREANHRITKCVITHVMSDAVGRFYVRFDQTTDLTWYGWKPYAYFSGSKSVTTTGLQSCVLILEPGLTTEFSAETAKADSYCLAAKERAKVLYSDTDANSARTAAVRDVQELDSNWIENLAGIKGTMDCINPLLDGLKAVDNKDFKLAKKALASAYLVYMYVIKPSLADYDNIKEDGIRILSQATSNRFSRERRRGAASRSNIPVEASLATLSYFVTYHLMLKHNMFAEVWGALEKLGLDPSAGQLWDLIPYSFVVDWFLPVGNSLKNLDAYNSLVLYRDVLARIESFKVQWPMEVEILKDLFNNTICSNGKPIEYSWYDRRVYQDVGSIDPIKISDCNGLTTSQMAQGAALLTQLR